MSMTERGTSCIKDTKCMGVELTSSPENMPVGNWPSDAFDASAVVLAVGLAVKPVGQAGCGGNPHVRSDERRRETG
jgi:hypothetical protein